MKKITAFIILLMLFCFTLDLDGGNKTPGKIYTVKEFLKVLIRTDRCLSDLHDKLKRARSHAVNGPDRVVRWKKNADEQKKELTSIYEELINYCKSGIQLINEAQFSNRNIFFTENYNYREYYIQTGEPDIIEKFTIYNPFIINSTNIVKQIIKELKPDVNSLFRASEQFSRLINQIRFSHSLIKTLKTRIEGITLIKELSSLSKYEEYNYKKTHYIRRSIRQTIRNIDDSISLLQAATAYLQDYQDCVIRIKELCNKGLYGISIHNDRMQMFVEIEDLSDECERIMKEAQFNTITIFYHFDEEFRNSQPYRTFPLALDESKPCEHFTFYSPEYSDGMNIIKFRNTPQVYTNEKATLRSMKKLLSNVEEGLKNISIQLEKIKTFQERLKTISQKKIVHYESINVD